MSIVTALAKGNAAAAEAELADHRKFCGPCSARRTRDCATGAELAHLARRLRDEANQHAAADQAPHPDQGALFDV